MSQMKVVLIGAAGLVGQNLMIQLNQFKNIHNVELVAVDKHPDNTNYLRDLNPELKLLYEDVTKPGEWEQHVRNCDVVVMLQAQIGSLDSNDFIQNNIESTKMVLAAIGDINKTRIVHISSSVVESVANDDYTNTKRVQEEIVRDSGIEYCILRPTLMFGWFDRKHLGWLSRFMRKVPVFPIPGNGKYMRQPLYAADFSAIIVDCIFNKKINKIYNISGFEQVDYIDMIKIIRSAVGAKCLVIKIPIFIFSLLLKIYAVFDNDPPFTSAQLTALIAGDEFEVIDWPATFSVKPTPFREAITETFTHPVYSKYELKF